MTTRAEAISRIFELDAKRTQGEIEISYQANGVHIKSLHIKGKTIADMRLVSSWQNAPFLAAAPGMVRIIRDLVAENEALNDALKHLRHNVKATKKRLDLGIAMEVAETTLIHSNGAWFKEQG